MKDIGYIALIIILLYVIKSSYNDYAEKVYSVLSPPVVLYYENSTLGYTTTTLQDSRGYRISITNISTLAVRISGDYSVGDTISIKPKLERYK